MRKLPDEGEDPEHRARRVREQERRIEEALANQGAGPVRDAHTLQPLNPKAAKPPAPKRKPRVKTQTPANVVTPVEDLPSNTSTTIKCVLPNCTQAAEGGEFCKGCHAEYKIWHRYQLENRPSPIRLSDETLTIFREIANESQL
jgi:hypothetical protein